MKTKVVFIFVFISLNVNAYFWNSLPNFNQITDTKVRKKEFINYLAPIIKNQNQKILKLRKAIKNQQLSLEFLTKLAQKYRTQIKNLLNVIDIIPTSLALAQAATESNWGRSRFAKYNNYYGIWCFKKGCGVVPNQRDSKATHEVAIFSNIKNATKYYMWTLNSHSAYQKLRKIRALERLKNNKLNGLLLIEGVEKYSEIGDEYIKNLQQIIKYNKLLQYD